MRKIINSKTKIFYLLIVLLFSSCEKYDSDFHIDQINPSNEGLIILGDQLENPYSVENMKLAYEALRNDNTLKSTINIEATHYYVRFKPINNQEQTLLTRDSSIYIYDYPLDHKIIKRGTYYHDPSIPSNEITWQYTVVPVDYDFPNIHSQILEELYLPHYTSNSENADKVQNQSSNWQALESHWEIVGTYDINWVINDRIAESWASGVDAKITADIYGTSKSAENMQTRTISYMTEGTYAGYTCIVWDLLDDHNQYGTTPGYPDDRVKGYTLSQIEFSLPMIIGSWSTWCNRLIDNFNNDTEEHVAYLFDQFDN